MSKLTAIESEHAQLREFVTERFDAMYDEIQHIQTKQQDLEDRFPQS